MMVMIMFANVFQHEQSRTGTGYITQILFSFITGKLHIELVEMYLHTIEVIGINVYTLNCTELIQ